jgi:serine/threonine-protein kinase
VLQLHEGQFTAYEIVRDVAQGTYADVFEARHTHPKLRDRRIALRVLRRSACAQHFLKAAQLNACLDHPRIPTLHEVGETAGRLYWARNFIEGDDLQNGIRGPCRSIEEVLRIAADVAGALDYAHGRGVVHGYVHPRHILLSPGGSRWLIGFGEYPPASGEILGNPLHLAPEQFEGTTVTPASDVYCLGETCIWLLCGRHPFHGLRITASMEAKRSVRLARDPQLIRPAIAVTVEQVLLRTLAPEPAARFSSPGEFATELVAAHRAGKKM